MKKGLLSLAAICLVGTMFAQTTPAKITKEQAQKMSISVPFRQAQTSNQMTIPALRSDILPNNGIGQTYYDLQTNGSLPQKLVAFPDGTLSATWTTASSGINGSNSRGAGYNYFDGNSWANSATNTQRIETARGGWATIAGLSNGEIVVSHNGSTGLMINVRPQKGTGDWTQTILTGPEIHDGTTGGTSTALLWPAVAASGNTIHLLACTESDTGSYYHGIQTCLLYYRGTYNESSNTIAWEEPRIVGDMGNHTDWFNEFGGDDYVIAANGNTVAIVVAGQWSDAFLWKSTDNGVNFTTTTIIDSYIPDNFDESIHYLDTTHPTYTTDGASAIAIDNNGLVHCAFGIAGVGNPELGDGYISIYYNIDGLLYWNENMPAITGQQQLQLSPDSLANAGYIVFTRQDLDGDGSLWYLNSNNAHPTDGYHRIGMTSQPSLAVDGNNVYLIYSSELDLPFYDANTMNMYYRGIFGAKSTDGGNTFGGISWLSYNKNCYYVDWALYDWDAESTEWTYESIVYESENIYPSVAQNIVNGNLAIIWHNDYFPDNAQGSIATNPTNILFMTLPADQLGTYNNIEEIPDGLWIDHTGIADNTLSGMKLYPNPANEIANILIGSTESANATLAIYNLMGQVVYTENVALNEGNNVITVNTNDLEAGVYMVNIKTNKGTSTQKLIVR